MPTKPSRSDRSTAKPAALETELDALTRALRRKAGSETRRRRLGIQYQDLSRRLAARQRELEALAAAAGLRELAAPATAAGPPAGVRARGPVEAVTRDVPRAAGKGFAFAEFLGEVGRSMVTAQEALDAQSKKYQASPGGQAMPSLFRLPRLSAGMRFAIEESTGSKLNLFFYSRQSAASETYQHTLDFEMVAVPPPPGGPPAAAPGLRQLLDAAEREAALRPLREQAAATAGALGLGTAELEASWPRLLLWELAAGAAPLLLLGHARDDETRGTLQLLRRPPAAPLLEAVVAPGSAMPPALVKELAVLAAEQARFLAP
jgi:hypothetical protein